MILSQISQIDCDSQKFPQTFCFIIYVALGLCIVDKVAHIIFSEKNSNFKISVKIFPLFGYVLYVIVIVRLVCDMVQAQHESRGRVLCLYHITH